MGVHLLAGHQDGGHGREACAMYDSTSGRAFGPLFDSADHAENFLAFASENDVHDVRRISEAKLEGLYSKWLKERRSSAFSGNMRTKPRRR